jgi:hypothetical protein
MQINKKPREILQYKFYWRFQLIKLAVYLQFRRAADEKALPLQSIILPPQN